MPLQIADVVADAANAELAEIREVLADLRGVQMELLGERVGRNRADTRPIELVQTAQVNGETIGGEFGDLIEALLGFSQPCSQFSQATAIVANANIVRMRPGHGRSTQKPLNRRSVSPRFLRVLRFALCLGLVYLTSADAQPAVRRATNIAAILAYPNFYHMRPILLVGTIAQQQNGEVRVSDGTASIRVIADRNAPDGLDEIRGQFWDLGRMKPDDPRLAGTTCARHFTSILTARGRVPAK